MVSMKRFATGAAVLALVALVGVVRAADDKPNLAGTWKWTQTFGGNTRDVTLKLKLDGEKLTGTISGRNNTDTAIEEATFKDGELSFSVTRDRNGQKVTTKYKGKLDGDTIKGKREFDRNGQAQSEDWEAKRSKD
jgi:hypothetical protein